MAGFGLAHIVKFWDAVLSEQFPDIEHRTPYEVPIERFGSDGHNQLALTIGNEFPSPRLLFSGGNRLIQLQPNWLAYNWRRVEPADSYNRYPANREAFAEHLRSLVGYLADRDMQLVPLQCEATYVNHIRLEAEDLSVGPFGRVFPQVQPKHGHFLPVPEGALFASSYIMSVEHRIIGRLHLRADHAWEAEGKVPIIVLNLTARGAPLSDGIKGVLDFCDIGREWIVKGFMDVTSSVLHERWQYQGGQV